MSKKFYPTLTAIPRLHVGDKMFRKTLINQHEEAMVVSVLANSKDSPIWTATLMTKNGVVFISGAVEQATTPSYAVALGLAQWKIFKKQFFI